MCFEFYYYFSTILFLLIYNIIPKKLSKSSSNQNSFLFSLILESTKKRRGRPRSNQPKKETKSYSIEDILKGPSYPLELVTTKVGGMKAAFQDYCFEFHFNRNGNKFWRCLSHAGGCPAKIMSKGSLVYGIDLNHNHRSDAVVFVNTVELVSNKTVAGPSHAQSEIIAATIKQPAAVATVKEPPAAVNLNASLREKMKQRLAVLNQKCKRNKLSNFYLHTQYIKS